MTVRLLIVLACLLTAFAVANSASVSAQPPVVAHAAAKKCGTAALQSGKRVRYISAVRVSCAVARKVAKRAKGHGYRAFGFRCRIRKSPGLPGKLFACGRSRKGVGQGVGFLYGAV